MSTFRDTYKEFTEYLNEHDKEVGTYEATMVEDAIRQLDSETRTELIDFLDDNPSYDEFADWCEEHGIRYH